MYGGRKRFSGENFEIDGIFSEVKSNTTHSNGTGNNSQSYSPPVHVYHTPSVERIHSTENTFFEKPIKQHPSSKNNFMSMQQLPYSKNETSFQNYIDDQQIEFETSEKEQEDFDDDLIHYSMQGETENLLDRLHLSKAEQDYHTPMDAVHRLYKVTGPELNRAYKFVVEMIKNTQECPEKTRYLIEEKIMIYPYDRKMDPIKRAVILYALCIFPKLQTMYCNGDNGGGVNTHRRLSPESLDYFIKTVVCPSRNEFMKCIETPHVFVECIMTVLKDHEGVENFFRSSKTQNSIAYF